MLSHDMTKLELEFMFMKHCAPNRCEPSIEALNFGDGRFRADVNGEVKFLRNFKIYIYIYIFFFLFFFFWGGGGFGRVRGGGSG